MPEEIVKDNGLRMVVVKEGNGDKPQKGQTVVAHYEIYFGDGTSSSDYDYKEKRYVDELYDSTYEDKPFTGPVEFVVGQTTPKDEVYTKGDSIDGFNEAFLDMRVGDKRTLFIPNQLAYGEEGASSFHTFFRYRVPPFRDLSCTLELVEIKQGVPAAAEKRGPAYEG